MQTLSCIFWQLLIVCNLSNISIFFFSVSIAHSTVPFYIVHLSSNCWVPLCSLLFYLVDDLFSVFSSKYFTGMANVILVPSDDFKINMIVKGVYHHFLIMHLSWFNITFSTMSWKLSFCSFLYNYLVLHTTLLVLGNKCFPSGSAINNIHMI